MDQERRRQRQPAGLVQDLGERLTANAEARWHWSRAPLVRAHALMAPSIVLDEYIFLKVRWAGGLGKHLAV